jgi:hypothetical protein
LTEICLCHACSCHELEDGNAPGQFLREWSWLASICGESHARVLALAGLSRAPVHDFSAVRTEPPRTREHQHVAVRRLSGGADGGSGEGEPFARVYWVAVPEALRARRVNRGEEVVCAGVGRLASQRRRRGGGAAVSRGCGGHRDHDGGAPAGVVGVGGDGGQGRAQPLGRHSHPAGAGAAHGVQPRSEPGAATAAAAVAACTISRAYVWLPKSWIG